MKKFIILITILLCSAVPMLAQNCTAKAPAKVGVNQQFQYVVTLDQNGNVASTDFGNFSKVNGPAVSSSQSISFVNGQQTSSYTRTFTYTLKPSKTGVQTIPGVTCDASGKKVKSNAVTIEVTKEDQQTQQRQQQQNRQSDPFDSFFRNFWGEPQRNTTQNQYDVFVKAAASKSNPYYGETVIVTYRLYTYNISNWQATNIKWPQQNNLWSYRMDDPNKIPEPKYETINGKRYAVWEIYKTAVAPQKSGSLTITPITIDMQMVTGSGFFQNVSEKTIKSNAIDLNVKALPIQGKGSHFGGLVGQFTLSSELAPTEVNVNDAIDFTITISGKGSLQLADNPDFNFPNGFDVTDPSVDDQINTNGNSVGGKRILKYVLIPRKKGTYEIPATTITYFDPESQSYKNLTTEKYTIEVKGENETLTRDKKEDVARPTDLGSAVKAFFTKYLWLFILIPCLILLLILILVIIRFIRSHSKKGDKTQKKVRHANRIAARRLKKARKLMAAGQDATFFEEISHALWDYLGHKFRIPLSDLSIDAVRNKLIDKGMSEEDIAQFTATLNDCEYARFAPGDKAEMMSKLFEQASDFITRMEKK